LLAVLDKPSGGTGLLPILRERSLDSGTVYLGVSQLDGGATHSGGALTCFQVYDGSYSACTCP
jgi:hypothetical protein